MKNLTSVTDTDLLALVKTKTQIERQTTLEVLELLREVYRRRLHLRRGYSSLHEFCVKELKYSDGAAHRRIKTMKLFEHLPAAETAIREGKISLSTATQYQKVIEAKIKNKQPLSMTEKTELFTKVQNQSRREVEHTLARVCPEVVLIKERCKPINGSQVKIELIVESRVFDKIERLKALTSHIHRSFRELLESLVDAEIKRRDPELRKLRTSIRKDTSVKSGPTRSGENKRYIPSPVRHHVWIRDRGSCTYTDPVSMKTCRSKHKLTFEHIQPFSMGGQNYVDNLRLLCSAHNQLTAINIFGTQKRAQLVDNLSVKYPESQSAKSPGSNN